MSTYLRLVQVESKYPDRSRMTPGSSILSTRRHRQVSGSCPSSLSCTKTRGRDPVLVSNVRANIQLQTWVYMSNISVNIQLQIWVYTQYPTEEVSSGTVPLCIRSLNKFLYKDPLWSLPHFFRPVLPLPRFIPTQESVFRTSPI